MSGQAARARQLEPLLDCPELREEFTHEPRTTSELARVLARLDERRELTPPRRRNMLKTPDALPTSVAATEPNTAFWAAGIAIDTPAPATMSAGTS
jgi:hypothetical protein